LRALRENASQRGTALDQIADDESVFSHSDPSLSTLIGTPYAVMKCRRNDLHSSPATAGTSDGTKVFINVCYHSLVIGRNAIVIGEECPKEVLGKNGEECFVYDVCVSLDSLEQDEAHLDQVAIPKELALTLFLSLWHSFSTEWSLC
jgi:hypothetical protein